jgi:hypothetical protein
MVPAFTVVTFDVRRRPDPKSGLSTGVSMQDLQRRARVVYSLCLAALTAGIVALLALTDIRHGEADVRAEWLAVQAAGIVILTALVASARLLRRILMVASLPSGAPVDASSDETLNLTSHLWKLARLVNLPLPSERRAFPHKKTSNSVPRPRWNTDGRPSPAPVASTQFERDRMAGNSEAFEL